MVERSIATVRTMLQLICSISKNYTLSVNSERVFLCLNYKIIFNQPSISTRAKLCGDIVTLPSANSALPRAYTVLPVYFAFITALSPRGLKYITRLPLLYANGILPSSYINSSSPLPLRSSYL